MTRNLIAMEVSPAKEESKGWALEQWNWFAHRFIEEMDKIEFKNKEGKVSSKRMDLANSKWIAMLHHDAKSGIPHLHFMVSRFTVDGRINDTNLIGEKAVMAANSINKSMGWKQSRKISEEHKAEIKGIFLSWPNFWAMITLTIYSATIAIFAAVYLCDWSRLWAEVWIPFTFLLSAAFLLGIIVLLNKIEGRLPKY